MTVAISGMLCIAAALLFMLKLPMLRNFVRPIYVKKGIIPEVAQDFSKQTSLRPRRSNEDIFTIETRRTQRR